MNSARANPPIPLLLVACGCLIALMTFGPRSAMGFFQLPMLAEKGWDRQTFGLAMAIQNLAWGIGTPLFGAIADRFGTWRVLALSALLYSSGLLIMAFAPTPFWLDIGGGVLVGLGIAAGSFGIILAAFARNVEASQRSMVFGFATAAGSAGMFVFAPLSQALIENVGWSDALVWLGALMLIIPVLAIPLRGNATSGTQSKAAYEQSVAEALREAMGHQSYILLVAGFFVCGFQIAFITAHFPAYLADAGVAPGYAVLALALIGLFNIVGSLGSGFISQRFSKPILLSLIYLARAALVVAFVLLPHTPVNVIAFSILMGLLWLSTVPPTNALVAIMFGTRHLGLIGGLVFLSHQIGSFLGVWLGGYLRDTTGSYDAVWWISVGLGIFAAIVHWPIAEKPVERPSLLQPAE
jgi:predicted MFS family arabinose efflux permease